MSKGSNWIGMDKNLVQEFKIIRREFSRIEAMFSFSVDKDLGVEVSISGYARIWSWSRCKVRKFLNEIETDEGHMRDRKKTDQRHLLLILILNLNQNQNQRKKN